MLDIFTLLKTVVLSVEFLTAVMNVAFASLFETPSLNLTCWSATILPGLQIENRRIDSLGKTAAMLLYKKHNDSNSDNKKIKTGLR